MPNLFIDTGYQLSEEDRLTNALMALLDHSDRQVLEEFVSLCLDDDLTFPAEAAVEFELQPAFDDSRPDASISMPDIDIYIETKRDTRIDRGQFERHWNYLLENSNRPTLLVAVTGRHTRPTLLKELEEQSDSDKLRASHLSWSDWLAAVVSLQEEFDGDTASGLLLRQFEDYLRALGYWHFDGPPVDRILDFGHALARLWSFHDERTRPYLEQRLHLLMERVNQALPGRDEWTLKTWGKRGAFSNGRYGISYFECVLDELGPQTRYRVSLELRPPGHLQLHYYLTIWHAEPHFDALGHYLLEQQDAFEHLAPFHRFDFWSDRRGFHCKKVTDGSHLHDFLNGDDAAADELAADVVKLFDSLDPHLDNFRKATA